MRNIHTAAIVMGLAALPAMGLAQSSGATLPSKATTANRSLTTAGAEALSAKAAQPRMHATRGIVKFVDANKLVISRSPQYGGEMSFVLNPSTERVGNLTVGSTVAVRYHSEAKQRIATAVTVEHAKQPPSAPGAHQ